MSRFMQVYEPSTEGIGTKLLSKRNYLERGAQNMALQSKADKRDSDTKIVFISEARFNDKNDNQLLRAWNPEDFNAFGISYGVYKQYSSVKPIAPKKQLIVSRTFWEQHADNKILVFQVSKSDCKKGHDLIAQPVITNSYTVSRDKLKNKKMTLSVRDLIRKCGWKAVATKVDGEVLK